MNQHLVILNTFEELLNGNLEIGALFCFPWIQLTHLHGNQWSYGPAGRPGPARSAGWPVARGPAHVQTGRQARHPARGP